MLKVTLFLIAAATLVGCASTRRESAAAIQAELPQLVDACNGAFQDGSKSGLSVVVNPEGIDACNRLNQGQSLGLVRPTTAEWYRRYSEEITYCQAVLRGTLPTAVLFGEGGPVSCEKEAASALNSPRAPSAQVAVINCEGGSRLSDPDRCR